MQLNKKIVLLVSALVGLVVTLLMMKVIETRSTLSTVSVVVARENLDQGAVIEVRQVQRADWPASTAPPDAYRSIEDVMQRMVRSDIVAGEPLLPGKLWPRGSKGRLFDLISPGSRAVSVKVNDVAGLDADSLVGAYVDILLSTRDDNNQPISRMVLQHVQVLSVPQAPASASGQKNTARRAVTAVTLQVSPQDAERLDLARSIGSLTLALRNQGDLLSSHPQGAGKDSLIPSAPVAATNSTGERSAPWTPPPTQPAIEVIRGLQKQAAP